jgi:prolycopene isomerase
MLASYLVEGAWYCRGSFQQLANALAWGVERQGGEVLLRSVVRRIRVQDGRAQGIVLENGQEIAAPIVISNADARQTFRELVGIDQLEPRFALRLARMRPSVSAFVVYAAGSYDARAAGLAHENFLWPSFDHDAHAASGAAGRPDWLTITVPTLLDPGLAPPGMHTSVLTTLLPHAAVSSWRASKEEITERLLARAEQVLPGLRASLSFVEAGTPRTLERYTRNDAGAAYGWEHSPEQVGLGRVALRSPIAGLFLAGHWTRPGGGVYGVVKSGIEVASLVTQRDSARLLAPA